MSVGVVCVCVCVGGGKSFRSPYYKNTQACPVLTACLKSIVFTTFPPKIETKTPYSLSEEALNR